MILKEFDYLRPGTKIFKVGSIEPHKWPQRRRRLRESKYSQGTDRVEDAKAPHEWVGLARQEFLGGKLRVAYVDFFQV
jgi:hypothetical protein